MTALVTRFALVGRSYPASAYANLHSASLIARAVRKGGTPSRRMGGWHGSSEAVVLPKRLSP